MSTTQKTLKNTTNNTNNNDAFYDQNKANLIRLKVNKVNLVQKLEPDDELITRLINVKVLTYEEAAGIMSARSREDRARNLITTLTNKFESSNTTSSRNTSNAAATTLKKDWYYLFRKVLAERGYGELVTFLDNTIINKPKFVDKFSSMSMAAQSRGWVL